MLFFYLGFIAGTILCALANSYHTLLTARIITGLFGGVIGSISLAIVAHGFDIHQRGRVMGFVQTGFGVSLVLGIPIGLYLPNRSGWRARFCLVVGMGTLIAVLIVAKLKPVTAHLAVSHGRSPLRHLLNTFSKKNYRIGFLATAFLSIG